MLTLFFFEGLDVAVITEMVYRLKPMQLRRKVQRESGHLNGLCTEMIGGFRR